MRLLELRDEPIHGHEGALGWTSYGLLVGWVAARRGVCSRTRELAGWGGSGSGLDPKEGGGWSGGSYDGMWLAALV